MLPCLSLLCVAVFGPASLVWSPAPGVNSAPTLSVQAYGSRDPACVAWTNRCVTCRAGENGGRAECSTPGIACTPGPIVCSARSTP